MQRNDSLPEWERLMAAAARLQQILPDAVLVGGTAAAAHAHHRLSYGADHTLNELRDHFDEVLAQLESVAGWQTARVRRPVLILGSLDGIETGVRQLIRKQPLETVTVKVADGEVTLPSAAEMLRIKGILILKRNATRDYLDFAVMAQMIGDKEVINALASFDLLYPQPNGESALQQLQVQLANPMPYDLDEVDLSEYKQLVADFQNWEHVKDVCGRFALLLLKSITPVS